MRRILLATCCVLTFCAAQNLLVNGDFELPRSVGWIRTAGGIGSMQTVNRDTSYHPDPDYEVSVLQASGPGWTCLAQKVDVPSTELTLRFSAKFRLDGPGTCWPVACVVARYCDASGTKLGETRFYHHTSYCTWTPNATLSLIEITNPEWNDYELDIAQELRTRLVAVNPANVAKIEVALYDTVSGG